MVQLRPSELLALFILALIGAAGLMAFFQVFGTSAGSVTAQAAAGTDMNFGLLMLAAGISAALIFIIALMKLYPFGGY